MAFTHLHYTYYLVCTLQTVCIPSWFYSLSRAAVRQIKTGLKP